MQLTQAMIAYWAPSPQALWRSREARFLCCHEHGNILWGVCQGSDEAEYTVLADLGDTQSPVFSCTCPSRQTPCKHVLALLLRRLDDDFSSLPPPPGLDPAKAGKSARPARKIPGGEQLSFVNEKDSERRAALERARELLCRLAEEGIDARTPASAGAWQSDVRPLFDMGIPAVAERLSDLPLLFSDKYAAAEEMARLFALCERAIAWLDRPAHGEDHELDTLLGRVWRLDELAERGYMLYDVSLLQLSFFVTDRPRARVRAEIGVWADISTGKVFTTENYLPYAAAGHVKTEDSCFDLLKVDKLFTYPGISRVRWKSCTPVKALPQDYALLCENAAKSLDEAIQPIIPELKDRYLRREPYCLVGVSSIRKSGGRVFLCDAEGQSIELREWEYPVLEVLASVYNETWKAALLRLSAAGGALSAVPLCLVSDNSAIRLTP